MVGWSWKFWPTPGRSTTTGMPKLVSRSRSPTPDRWRSAGVCIPPAATRTSLLAVTVVGPVLLPSVATYCTPVAFLAAEKSTLATVVDGSTW